MGAWKRWNPFASPAIRRRRPPSSRSGFYTFPTKYSFSAAMRARERRILSITSCARWDSKRGRAPCSSRRRARRPPFCCARARPRARCTASSIRSKRKWKSTRTAKSSPNAFCASCGGRRSRRRSGSSSWTRRRWSPTRCSATFSRTASSASSAATPRSCRPSGGAIRCSPCPAVR